MDSTDRDIAAAGVETTAERARTTSARQLSHEAQRTGTGNSSTSSSSDQPYPDIGLSRTHSTQADLERRHTSMSRIQTARTQHSATVGRGPRDKECKKPLPNFGFGKSYPPPLPAKEEYVVEFDGPDDPLHAQNWPFKKKLYTAVMLGLTTLTAAFASSIFSAAIPSVSKQFHVGEVVGTLGVSLYVLGFATGPTLWAPLSELKGRRLPILISMFGFAIFQFAVAVAKDLQTVLICRFWGGFFGACPLSVVAAVFSDMFDNKTRGLAITVFSMTVFSGPLIAPFIGGFITESYLGWRWTEYISGIMGITCFVLDLIWLEETYPPVVLIEKAAELRRRTKNWGIHAKQEEIELDFKELVTKNFSRPMRLLFTEPIIFLLSLYMAFIYGLLYLFLTAYPVVFQGVHGMSPGIGGLPYFGMITGQLFAGLYIVLIQPAYNRKLDANNGVPIPEWRLPTVIVGGAAFAIGLFFFGWTGYTKSIHWIVPTLSGLFTGFGLLTIFLQSFNYLIDAYLMFAASAIAANTFLRSLAGAGFPLFARQMFSALGVNWTGTLLGCVATVLVPIPAAFWYYGERIRARSPYAPTADPLGVSDSQDEDESHGEADSHGEGTGLEQIEKSRSTERNRNARNNTGDNATDNSLAARLMTLGPTSTSKGPSVIGHPQTSLVPWQDIPTIDFIKLPGMADRAQDPLMGGDDHDYDDTIPAESASEHEDPSSTPTLFVWLLTLSAGISGLLFGYDTGVISATLVSIGTSLSSRALTTLDKSLIAASTSLFALLVSPISGLLADSLGRKRVILIADLLFILGALVQAVATSVWVMVAGRSVVGLAVGAASFVTPLYIAELAPSMFRGRLVTLNVLFITLGQVVAYLIGWGFAELGGETGWRWMVGLGALPAALQCLVMVAMPETPRWLAQAGRTEEAKIVLQKVFGTADMRRTVQPVMKAIEREVREEEEAKRERDRRSTTKDGGWLSDSWSELFGVPGNVRALTIACLLQGLQQLCGFNSLMYFSATLFSLLGFATPTLTSLSVAATNAIFTVLSLLLIDRLGRRRILLLSIPVMIFALLCCAATFHYIILPSTNSHNPSADAPVPILSRTSPLLVVASIILYVAGYATGLGNVPWQQSELFPLNIRSLGSSLATAMNWGSNTVVGLTFLQMLDGLGPSWTFLIYAFVCLVGWFAIWLVYPETRGLTLEETGELLKDGWGVQRGGGRLGRGLGAEDGAG
ncbi:hypothetical protein V500_09694 [Pseudogymnoascus sp. VKM F-4518 (FW-2643)]|nr:hypothetical protein V500_09694 [Pseudogymnoascus sp. VKM F-4518 (FW-2643)]